MVVDTGVLYAVADRDDPDHDGSEHALADGLPEALPLLSDLKSM